MIKPQNDTDAIKSLLFELMVLVVVRKPDGLRVLSTLLEDVTVGLDTGLLDKSNFH
jgi:hypothetical protein